MRVPFYSAGGMLWTMMMMMIGTSSMIVRHGRAFSVVVVSSSTSSILRRPIATTTTIMMGRHYYDHDGVYRVQQQQQQQQQQRRQQPPRQQQYRLYCASSSDATTTTTDDVTDATTISTSGSSTSSSSTRTTRGPPSSTLSQRPPRMKTIEIQRQFEKAEAATTITAENPPVVITIMGWVRTIRKQKKCAFLQVNDGSTLAGLQCVVTINDDDDSNNNSILDGITTGAAVELHGTIIASLGGRQAYELAVTYVSVIGTCPGETYPLAKKRHSLEYLRTIAHLRPRTNTLAAIARVRSQLAGAIHSFFQTRGVLFLQTPLITSSDCEGAGEMFRVTTLDIDQPDQLPMLKPPKSSSSDQKKKKEKNDDETITSVAAAAAETDPPPQLPKSPPPNRRLDVSRDFFAKPAYLTVSGQLAAETYACALGDVYTFGPTFRAENSQTTRHLAEFHMVEPEYAFCDLDGVMDNAEEMLQHVVRHVLKHCQEDLAFFNEFYDKNLLERLQKLVDEPFARVSYRRAVRLLREEIARDPTKWQFPNVTFGTDLATEHERWLAESKFQTAVFVYNYPKSIKSFYMRDNDDNGSSGDDAKDDDDDDNNTKDTVAATDLLVPGVGELIGGSQREDRLDVLVRKMEELDLNVDDYWWYLDLRRYGSVPHAGYGLGFERLVTYVCGMENIREAIAFPRYPGNAEF